MMKATMRMSTASRQENWSWRRRSYQFICRSAALSVVGSPWSDNRQPTTDNSSPLLLDRAQHFQEIHRLPHIMNPHHGRAGAMRGGHRGQRADGAIGSRSAASEV